MFLVQYQHRAVDFSLLLSYGMLSQSQEHYCFDAWTDEQRLVHDESKPKSLTTILFQLMGTKSIIVAFASRACKFEQLQWQKQ
jgi:hypothetical protein